MGRRPSQDVLQCLSGHFAHEEGEEIGGCLDIQSEVSSELLIHFERHAFVPMQNESAELVILFGEGPL